jgi:hypothetical protein
MKVLLNLLLILLLNTINLGAQEIVTPPLKPITAFNVGEILTYQIRYGIVVGGTTTLSLTEEVYKRKMVFHALAVGQTTGLANALYGVKDIYESWFDKKTNLPYKQVRSIKEGSYTQYNEVTYNRTKNTVESNLTGEHKVPEKILDLASTLYYIRRVDLSKVKKGNVIVMNMYFSDAIFPFHLKYRGKETIKTEFGRIRCHKISPVVEPGRIFKSKDDLTIWFTDDESCLPVLVRMDIRVVGNVLLKLVKYENTLNPLVIQK